MKKIIFCLCLILAIGLSGCSFANSDGSSNNHPEPETVIVKETVIVTETVYVTEPNNEEETPATTENTTSEESENKGYTTQDVLKKADEASDNQYWIVYFGEGRLMMSTFNALENFTVKWTSDGELVCDKMVGSSIVKDWDSDKSTFTRGMHGNRTDVAFKASEIVGSNCDIYDEKNDKTISAKTE